MHLIRNVHSASSALDEDTQPGEDNRSIASQLIHLARDCHAHQGQPFEIAQFLCQEIVRITRGHAELLLSGQTRTMQGTIIIVPIACRHRHFGILHWDAQTPVNDLRDFAQVCGDILCHVALAALVYEQTPEDMPTKYDPLTPRELEVLACMRNNQSQQEIAEALHIQVKTVQKHYEHIYEKLHVNHALNVSIAAYNACIYSPLEAKPVRPQERGLEGAVGAR